MFPQTQEEGGSNSQMFVGPKHPPPKKRRHLSPQKKVPRQKNQLAKVNEFIKTLSITPGSQVCLLTKNRFLYTATLLNSGLF